MTPPHADNATSDEIDNWRQTDRLLGSGGWADPLVQDMVATR